jgi:hypothetical protein
VDDGPDYDHVRGHRDPDHSDEMTNTAELHKTHNTLGHCVREMRRDSQKLSNNPGHIQDVSLEHDEWCP